MSERILFKKVGENNFLQIYEPKKGAWINLINPTLNQLEEFAQKYKLDFSIITDALDTFEVPRLEIEDEKKYIFARFPLKKAGHIETETILFVISDSYFMNISKFEVPVMETFEKLNINTTQKTKMFIQYLLAINAEYSKQILLISKKIREFSTNIEKIDNKDIVKFVDYERILNDFLAALVPMNLVFERILYGKLLTMYEQDEDLVQDLNLNTEQLIESCKSNLKYLVNIRESFSTILSNNLNRTMKILTSVTVLLTVPNIIYSFFGMNVILPFQSHPFTILGIILLSIFIMVLLVLIFFKGKLLK